MAKMTNATTWSKVGPDDGTGSLIDLNYTCPHCDYPTGELIFIGPGRIEAGRRIETVVEMDYYLLPSVTVKTFSFDQIWVYTEKSDTSEESFLIVTPFPEFP